MPKRSDQVQECIRMRIRAGVIFEIREKLGIYSRIQIFMKASTNDDFQSFGIVFRKFVDIMNFMEGFMYFLFEYYGFYRTF